MTGACLSAKGTRTGGHVLQGLPNPWPGQAGRRCGQVRAMEVRKSKYTVDLWTRKLRGVRLDMRVLREVLNS